VRWRRESRLAFAVVLAGGVLLGASLPGAGGAGSQKREDALRRQQSGLSAQSRSALLSLYALDSRLAQARSELTRIRSRAQVLRDELQGVEREVGVVEDNLKSSQRLLGRHLRALYEEGEPNALAVLLGASSLDDAVTRLNELERSASQGARAVTDAQDGRVKLRSLAAELAARVQEVQALEVRAEQTAAALVNARAQHLAYIALLARQRRLNGRQISTLDAHARRVVERAQIVQAQSTVTAPTAVGPVGGGMRTLTVTSTGYSLPGHTATGLPVGLGIVAVDPSVIPLGTAMTIPGYGEGVAADTGSAVQGYAIDLWFPTLADALAWGRRTVTISLH
jgi:3D (Asp-Asp-Asp) domain-containing protein/peptidoglycan hydrolase CwlO-like protein